MFAEVGSGLKDSVVLTDNRCPTYLLNLWDLGPRNVLPLTPLSDLVRLLATSASPLAAANLSSPLSPAERHTVRLIAEGHTNREIAQRRHVSEGVVRNTVNAIYRKLNLTSRVHIAFYYYGQWHLLAEWERPGFLHPHSWEPKVTLTRSLSETCTLLSSGTSLFRREKS